MKGAAVALCMVIQLAGGCMSASLWDMPDHWPAHKEPPCSQSLQRPWVDAITAGVLSFLAVYAFDNAGEYQEEGRVISVVSGLANGTISALQIRSAFRGAEKVRRCRAAHEVHDKWKASRGPASNQR